MRVNLEGAWTIHPPKQAFAVSERKVFPEDFPEGLKPRLRLFLSVDLEGSTRFKQSRHVWRPEILSFYRDFDFILQDEYRIFAEGLRQPLPAAEFWKSNGDELLYVCELQSLSHAHALMHIWLAALSRYRAENGSTSHQLDVKSTAWVGLFPAPIWLPSSIALAGAIFCWTNIKTPSASGRMKNSAIKSTSDATP